MFTDFAALTDGALALRVLDIMPGWPGYHLAIHRTDTESIVGRIIVRFDAHPSIALYAGNIAYEVDPEHRGQRHAARACRLLPPIARHHEADTLWIVTSPENLASCRTAEGLGGEYVDTLPMPPDTDMYAQGMRWARRYRWRLA